MDGSELRRRLEYHHEASYGWALSCCGRNVEEAEEVLQTAYLKILDGQARFDGRAAFKTWLFAVIRRTAIGERRRHWLRKLMFVRYERGLAAAPETPLAPPDILIWSERQKAFLEALTKLPRRQQEVLHLVFYQGMSISEAATVLGLSRGSVRQHYERGKERLRAELQAWDERDE